MDQELTDGPIGEQNASLILLCGRSFSGKSVIAYELAANLHLELISYDALNEQRGLHGGDGIPVEEWGYTNDAAHELARAALTRGRGAVVDDTSSPRFLRDQWRSVARQAAAQFALVYVDTDLDTIRARHQANREVAERHDVSDEVFEEHLTRFEAPAEDEPHVAVTSPIASGAHIIEQIASLLKADD